MNEPADSEMPRSDPAHPSSIRTLKQLREAEAACRRCPLYRDATQAVPGDGRVSAQLMLVGEQPGDREDLAGEPFVGPAGRMLDRALIDAGIPRRQVFVTNAVKHFKHEMRGKRRLHKRPNAYEIDRCRWWLELELAIVKPAGGACARRDRGAQSAPPHGYGGPGTAASPKDGGWNRRFRHDPPVAPPSHPGESRQGTRVPALYRRHATRHAGRHKIA